MKENVLPTSDVDSLASYRYGNLVREKIDAVQG